MIVMDWITRASRFGDLWVGERGERLELEWRSLLSRLKIEIDRLK
jgi:hypothetical protein